MRTPQTLERVDSEALFGLLSPEDQKTCLAAAKKARAAALARGINTAGADKIARQHFVNTAVSRGYAIPALESGMNLAALAGLMQRTGDAIRAMTQHAEKTAVVVAVAGGLAVAGFTPTSMPAPHAADYASSAQAARAPTPMTDEEIAAFQRLEKVAPISYARMEAGTRQQIGAVAPETGVTAEDQTALDELFQRITAGEEEQVAARPDGIDPFAEGTRPLDHDVTRRTAAANEANMHFEAPRLPNDQDTQQAYIPPRP